MAENSETDELPIMSVDIEPGQGEQFHNPAQRFYDDAFLMCMFKGKSVEQAAALADSAVEKRQAWIEGQAVWNDGEEA